jgi:aryl-phospho-beta-D-glucosidase BglC (GH1 family)
MTRFLLVLLLLLTPAIPALAGAINLNRGVALDTWLTWPGDERLADPALIQGFPEWRATVTDTDLASLKAAGFDFVRMPLDPAVFLLPANRTKWGKLTKGMMEAVRRVEAAGLKVVVDLHAMPVSAGWKSQGIEAYLASDTAFADYQKLVAHIGKALSAENPGRVAFEPMNEPTSDCDWGHNGEKSTWQAMAQKLHATARTAAPELTLILSGACWGGAWGLSHLDPRPLQDENILWSFHNYEPFIFSHQGASWTGGPETHVSGLSYPPDRKQRKNILKAAEERIAAADLNKAQKAKLLKELRYNIDQYMSRPRREMDKSFATVAKWAKKYSIPPARIFLGEFGANRARSPELDDASRARFFQDIRIRAERAGYAWSVWAWSGSFGIASRNEGHDVAPALRVGLGLQ